MIIDTLLSDFRPTRVACAGRGAARLAEALRARGVQVWLLEPLADSPDTAVLRCDLSIGVDVLAPADGPTGSSSERAIEQLCRHSDTVLLIADAELATRDCWPQSYWVTQCARWSFYRDVDYDAAALAGEALCLRRLVGDSAPVLASYERLCARLTRELSAQRLLTQEYQAALHARELEVVELGDSYVTELGQDLLAVKAKLAPLGTTRERYWNRALGRVHEASRVVLRGLEFGERLVRRALPRGPSAA